MNKTTTKPKQILKQKNKLVVAEKGRKMLGNGGKEVGKWVNEIKRYILPVRKIKKSQE